MKHEAHYALLTLYEGATWRTRNRVLPIILVSFNKDSEAHIRSAIHRRGRRETALSQQNAPLTPACVISKVIGHRPSRAL